MKTLFISIRLLWKRKIANGILVLEIFLSVFMLAQMYVYITDYNDNVRAMNELPQSNTFILNAFSYCDKGQVLESIMQDPMVDAVDRVYMGNTTCHNVDCNLVVYPQSVIKRYSPRLQSGEWLSSNDCSNTNELQAVVSSDVGLRIGETATIRLADKRQVSICVIGILETPTQYLYPSGGASATQFAVDSIIDQYSVVMLRAADYGDPSALILPDELGIPENIFVFLRPSTTEAEINSFKDTYRVYGEIISMDTLVANYRAQSSVMINSGIIFFVVFFFLAVTSILSNSIVQMQYNKKLFMVYFILGMNWKKTIVIEVVRIIILELMVICILYFAGKNGWLMLEWMTAERASLFYVIAIVYTVFILMAVSAGSLIKMARTDISASLKNMQQYE